MPRRPARPSPLSRPARPARLQSPSPAQLRAAVVATARKMNALDINRGTAGNVSARARTGFLITPSAMPYAEMTPADIVQVDLDGRAKGPSKPSTREPSTEWRFHHAIYATRPEVGAVVHTHSVFATALACLERPIPAFHYMVAKAGGNDIRCAPYAAFGTQELADEAVRALDGRLACLLSHHGMIAVGDNLDAALALAVEVEWMAEVYVRALQIGEPAALDDAAMREVIERFAAYGQAPRASKK